MDVDTSLNTSTTGYRWVLASFIAGIMIGVYYVVSVSHKSEFWLGSAPVPNQQRSINNAVFLPLQWNLSGPSLELANNSGDIHLPFWFSNCSTNCINDTREFSIALLGDSHASQRVHMMRATLFGLCNATLEDIPFNYSEIPFTRETRGDCTGCGPHRFICPYNNVTLLQYKQEFICDDWLTRPMTFRNTNNALGGKNGAKVKASVKVNRKWALSSSEYYLKLHFPFYGWPNVIFWHGTAMHDMAATTPSEYAKLVDWYLTVLNATVPYNTTNVVFTVTSAFNHGHGNEARNKLIPQYNKKVLDLIINHNNNPFNRVKIHIFPIDFFQLSFDLIDVKRFRDSAHIDNEFATVFGDYMIRYACMLRDSNPTPTI